MGDCIPCITLATLVNFRHAYTFAWLHVHLILSVLLLSIMSLLILSWPLIIDPLLPFVLLVPCNQVGSLQAESFNTINSKPTMTVLLSIKE